MTFFELTSKNGTMNFRLSWWFVLVLVIVVVLGIGIFRARNGRHWEPVDATIHLGGIGDITLRPNNQDIQIAHRAWVELATRKGAILFDEDNDVIVEVYDSWYSLFQTMRELAASIPAPMIRHNASTQTLVRLLVDALNDGLRPHLTKWQARFRRWYSKAESDDQFAGMSPQDIQKNFPNYKELTADLKQMNDYLKEYTNAIRMIAHGHNVIIVKEGPHA